MRTELAILVSEPLETAGPEGRTLRHSGFS